MGKKKEPSLQDSLKAIKRDIAKLEKARAKDINTRIQSILSYGEIRNLANYVIPRPIIKTNEDAAKFIRGICQHCGKEIEWSTKGKWIHSPFQVGRPISLSEAEELAKHDAVLKPK